MIHVLALVVPTLFLAAVVGLSILWRRRLGMLGWMGMALAVYAWDWSVVEASVGEARLCGRISHRGSGRTI